MVTTELTQQNFQTNTCTLSVVLMLSFIFTIAIIIKLDFFSFDIEQPLEQYNTNSIPSNITVAVNISIMNKIVKHNKTKENIQPFISTQNKTIAYQKFINGKGNIKFFHARKAAGSAVSQWLKNLVNRQHIGNTFDHQYEAFPSWMKKNTNPINKYMTNNGDDSIFVITLRDPIDRILSHYEFEWKWGCNPCCRTNSDVIQQPINDKNDKYPNLNVSNYLQVNMVDQWWVTDGGCNGKGIKYKFANIELEDLLRRVEKFDMNNDANSRSKFGVDVYLDNYYLWMFCCYRRTCRIKKDFIDTGKINEC
eukprot:366490_1